MDRLGALCAEAGLKGKCLIVTDENVGAHYARPALESMEKAGFDACMVTLPAGEKTKDKQFLFDLYTRCLESGLDRRSFIVALGGGVIGDLAGYAAASFLRGIPFVQVPTTLLSMVDSSVGGKTGINLPQGKNLVGSFHQPALVLADLHTLQTLEPRQYRAGLSEVIKYGVIYDGAFFQTLEECVGKLPDTGNVELLAKVVGRCCEIKADVVAQDEREGGLRAILNFGHTAGHALENAAGYGEFLHGEAVSIGMVYAGLASMELCGLSSNDCKRIKDILQALELPVRAPSYDWKELRGALSVDKKTVGGMPKFVLASEIGTVSIGNEVPEETMEGIWHVLNE
ncbi:MAG: 3-dehydroquinate synthase [Kiritimatiellales bacterium]|nr:3-dehydroquinate synthase [Kiritimatiellales bacterium]